jgi:predicted DNA-binding protein with PD1-like motif
MKYIKILDNKYLIKLKKGEKIVENLMIFINENKILSGYFYGLGAASKVEMAHYNVETQKYSSRIFDRPLEITNIIGSLGIFEEKPLIHPHITVADDNFQVFGGHLVEATISGTLELVFIDFKKALHKRLDPEVGLKTFDI